MYYDETQRLMDRASLFLFIASLADIISIILLITSIDLLSNNLPSPIAIKYFQYLTFPGLNAVTGLISLAAIMALIGGFMIYMARGSLNRREFMALPRMILTGSLLTLIALLSSIGVFAIYDDYAGMGTMMGPLLPGTLSLLIAVVILLLSLIFTIISRSIASELGKRYKPRTIRRQRPPPPPPPQ